MKPPTIAQGQRSRVRHIELLVVAFVIYAVIYLATRTLPGRTLAGGFNLVVQVTIYSCGLVAALRLPASELRLERAVLICANLSGMVVDGLYNVIVNINGEEINGLGWKVILYHSNWILFLLLWLWVLLRRLTSALRSFRSMGAGTIATAIVLPITMLSVSYSYYAVLMGAATLPPISVAFHWCFAVVEALCFAAALVLSAAERGWYPRLWALGFSGLAGLEYVFQAEELLNSKMALSVLELGWTASLVLLVSGTVALGGSYTSTRSSGGERSLTALLLGVLAVTPGLVIALLIIGTGLVTLPTLIELRFAFCAALPFLGGVHLIAVAAGDRYANFVAGAARARAVVTDVGATIGTPALVRDDQEILRVPEYGNAGGVLAMDVRPVTIGVIIALVEELDVVLEQVEAVFGAVTILENRETGGISYLAQRPTARGLDARIIMSLVGKGQERAAAGTMESVLEHEPDIVVSVGIAGALSEDVRVGDVAVGRQVVSYLANAKALPSAEARYELAPGYDSLPSDELLVYRLEQIHHTARAAFALVQGRQRARMEEFGFVREFRIVCGPIACGPIVGAAEEFKAWLRTSKRDYIALDMESSAAAIASVMAAKGRRNRFLALRGISDGADRNKSELEVRTGGLARRAAVAAALEVLVLLIDDLPPTPLGKHDAVE